MRAGPAGIVCAGGVGVAGGKRRGPNTVIAVAMMRASAAMKAAPCEVLEGGVAGGDVGGGVSDGGDCGT